MRLLALVAALGAYGCVDPVVPRKPGPQPTAHKPSAPPPPKARLGLTMPSPTSDVAPVTPPVASTPEPHPDAGRVVALTVPGFAEAVLAIPKGGADPRPLVIAAHANWDRPSWECEWWRRLLPDSFILCPRGILRDDSPSPDDPRYTYENDRVLEAEVDAGVAALEAKYGGRVETAPILWVGLSRGAYLGSFIAARQPERFPRLILVEGGHDPWTADNAASFARGGLRVLFICGQGACNVLAKKAVRQLDHAGIETQLHDVPKMGHGLNADADAPILKALPWLMAD